MNDHASATHGYFGSLGFVVFAGVFERRRVEDAEQEHPRFLELMARTPTDGVDARQIFLKNVLLLKIVQRQLRRDPRGFENTL